MILRLPITIELFNIRGELVQKFNSTKKSQIRVRLSRLSSPESKSWTYGICRVYYNKPNDFWNAFYFKNYNQLVAGLITVTEEPLISYFKADIPPEYLEKRKSSPKQRAAFMKNRMKSKLFGVKK